MNPHQGEGATSRFSIIFGLCMGAMGIILVPSCSDDNGGGPSGGGLGEPCFEDGTCNAGLVCDDTDHCVEKTGDPCEGVECSGHGSCVVQDGAAACDCDEGFHADGLECVDDGGDPCDGVECSGHGSCVVQDGAAACDCDEGFHADGLECVEDTGPESPVIVGTTYYVDAESGNDANVGTSPAEAWQTLARVSSADLAPGDGVLFKRGQTFRGQLDINRSGTADKQLIFSVYGNRAKPILQAASPGQENTVTIRGDHVTVFGIEVVGGARAGILVSEPHSVYLVDVDVGREANRGVWVSSPADQPGTDFVMDHCRVHSQAEDYPMDEPISHFEGLYVTRSLVSSRITHCVFKDWYHASINLNAADSGEISDILVDHCDLSAPNLPYGGRIAGEGLHHCEFYANEIHDNGNPIQINGHHNHIHHNFIHDIHTAPDHDRRTGKGISLSAYSNDIHDSIIENNLIMNTEDECVYIHSEPEEGRDVHDMILQNNIFFNCGYGVDGVAIHVRRNMPEGINGVVISHNIVFRPDGPAQVRLWDQNGIDQRFPLSELQAVMGHDNVVTALIEEDPLFVSTVDFHVQPGSPAIGTGVKPVASFDYEGTPILPPYNIGLFDTPKP